MYKPFDTERWSRREHYQLYSSQRLPFYLIASDIDVTRLLEYKREHGLSFYLSLIYLATKALNEQEEMRLRVVDGQVVLYDRIHPNWTHLRKGETDFLIHTGRLEGTMAEFVEKYTAAMAEQTAFFGGHPNTPDLVYYSALPWVATTAVTNPGMENPDDAIQRVVWGKYVERNGRYFLNISFTANHRFVDGYHIAQFFLRLQSLIDSL